MISLLYESEALRHRYSCPHRQAKLASGRFMSMQIFLIKYIWRYHIVRHNSCLAEITARSDFRRNARIFLYTCLQNWRRTLNISRKVCQIEYCITFLHRKKACRAGNTNLGHPRANSIKTKGGGGPDGDLQNQCPSASSVARTRGLGVATSYESRQYLVWTVIICSVKIRKIFFKGEAVGTFLSAKDFKFKGTIRTTRKMQAPFSYFFLTLRA